MSNMNTVKAQIQSLIDSANATTGNADTNLTDGVNALISGYGQGSSGGSGELASIKVVGRVVDVVRSNAISDIMFDKLVVETNVTKQVVE